MEGFSSEEGFPEMFGTTMFEGQANLGVARVAADGSWLATVPANVPLHLQAVDVFGMSLENEPVWFSARAGESRVCGGCHENRAEDDRHQPRHHAARSPSARPTRWAPSRAPAACRRRRPREPLISADGAGTDKLVGMAWDKALQPVFDAKCVSCHSATQHRRHPWLHDHRPATGNIVSHWTFNLSNDPVTIDYGMGMIDDVHGLVLHDGRPRHGGHREERPDDRPATSRSYMNPQDSRNSDAHQDAQPDAAVPDAGHQRPRVRAPRRTRRVAELHAT